MSTYREELAWAGGLFEGEGTIGNWRNNTGKNGDSRQCVSRIMMADLDVLERYVMALSPIQLVVRGPYGPYGKSKKVLYQVSTSRFETTQALVAMLWPWLAGRRREQCMKALRY